MKKQVHVFNVALVSIVITLGNVRSLTNDEEECLKMHSVWKASRGKCSKECKECPFGTGRNFTSIDKLVRKSNGDLRCPTCEECQVGYYSDGRVTCTQCVVNCWSYNRHVQQECTKVHDVSCGSCLPGYDDVYQSTDFPCLQIENEKPNTSTISQQDGQIHVYKPQVNNNTVINTSAGSMAIVDQHDGKHVVLPAVVIAFIVLLLMFFVLVAILVVIGFKRDWRISCITDLLSKYCGRTYNRVSSQDSIDDLETDGGTGRKIANYDRQDSNDVCQRTRIHHSSHGPEAQQCVRGEIQSHLNSAQEVPATSSTNHYRWQNDNYQNIGKHCKCRIIPGCPCCAVFRNGPDRLLERSDSIIRYIATQICHNPNKLFESLGVQPCKVYQLNDTRNRDPIGFTEAEMVLRLLNSWIERDPNKATLKTLCKSLCQTGFHDIVREIKTMLRLR